MAFTNFARVAELDVPEQRDLLTTGAPEEQVWAAWALGLALGARANPDLRAALERADHSGVRRHLVVMLAGLGERSLLEGLAEGEIDEAVRATASQYLLQTGTTDETSRVRPLLEALLRDPSAKVRRALLIAGQEIPAASGLTRDDLLLLLNDVDSEVRDLAIEALLRVDELEQLFPGALEDHIPLEPDIHLRRRLMRLAIGAGRSRHLLTLASGAEAVRKLELLQTLHEHRLVFTRTELTPLITQQDPAADYYLAFLLDEQSAPEAMSWLLAQCARAIDSPYPPGHSDLERYNFSTRCYILLDRALARADMSQLAPADQGNLAAIKAHLEAFRKQLDEAREQYEAVGMQMDWSQYDHIQRRLVVLERIRAFDDKSV